jgi:membrane protein DedA with SNARE-associated domain
VELWGRLTTLLLRLIEQYDDQAIFIILFIEETGFPLPLPGDVAMILAGIRVAQGEMNLVWALFLLELASLLGASILFWVSARGGRPLLYRFGRYIHLDRAKLDRAEVWIQKYQGRAVVVGRITPGLRNITVIASGVFGVPYRVFVPAYLVGSFVYLLFFVMLGIWVGPSAIDWIQGPRISLRVILTITLFFGLGAFLVVMYRRTAPVRHLARQPAPEARKIETALMAGFLATLEMGTGVNVLLYLLNALGIRWPERTLVLFLDKAAAQYADGNFIQFVASLALFTFLGGLVWAVIYAHVAPRLPAAPSWLRGLLFSLLPLAFSTLVWLPLLGAGFLGLGLGVGLLPFIAEVFRNALFGVGLGASYALLRAARQLPARAVPAGPTDPGDPADLPAAAG